MGKAASPLASLGGRRHLQAQLVGVTRLSSWVHGTLTLSHQALLIGAQSLAWRELLKT